MKVFVFGCLFFSFLFLFRATRLLRRLGDLAERTRLGMDASARQRTLENRRRLMELKERHTMLTYFENLLRYSGVRRRVPGLTVEWWVVLNLAAVGGIFVILVSFAGFGEAGLSCAVIFLVEMGALQRGRMRNLKRVNENLLKLLDFLGNYSITSGELTGVLAQVSRYMEEPIRGALEVCYMEAKTTGDTGAALLSMSEYVEHPKFRELARNMEISVRYSADFSAMVSSSRRSIREYLRVLQERRGMLRESFINMLLLLGMSLMILAVVGSLIEFSIWSFLVEGVPGRIAIAAVAVILGLFAAQARRIQL